MRPGRWAGKRERGIQGWKDRRGIHIEHVGDAYVFDRRNNLERIVANRARELWLPDPHSLAHCAGGSEVLRRERPADDRHTPSRPLVDIVFDRTAEGRVLKCLAIVDDATTEAVAIVPARALGGLAVTRVLDRLAATRGYRGCCAPITAWSSVAAPC